MKAAEDSRTPRRCRDGLHATTSARSWSAAVLCRFDFSSLGSWIASINPLPPPYLGGYGLSLCGGGFFFGAESDDAERGQSEFGGVRFAVAFMLSGNYAAHIADIAAAVHSGVAVDDFAPFAWFGKPNAIAETRNRSQVKNHSNGLFAFGILANEGGDAGFAVGSVDPIKALWIEIVFPERGFSKIQLV